VKTRPECSMLKIRPFRSRCIGPAATWEGESDIRKPGQYLGGERGAARFTVSDPTASDGFMHIVKIRYIIRSVAMQMRERQPAPCLRVVHALKTVS
jgi:hypothetical protein